MLLHVEVTDKTEHKSSSRRMASENDRAWERVRAERAAARAVRFVVADKTERRSLARSVGRWANRGFEVDIRSGDDVLPVRKSAIVDPRPYDQDSEPRESGFWGEQETIETDGPGGSDG